jgi:hypothetical protein
MNTCVAVRIDGTSNDNICPSLRVRCVAQIASGC